MNDVAISHGAEPRKILQSVIEEEIPAIMSYLSKDKWHVAKLLLKKLGASQLTVQVITDRKPHPVNVQLNQPVGVSLKYRYGKVVFDTTIVAFESSSKDSGGGQIVLSVPDRVEIIQRRSYFRVNVPKSLRVNVAMWHRRGTSNGKSRAPDKYWQGRLMDISAGGLQVAVDNAARPDFRRGQFLTLRLTAIPYEQPLMFNTQVRSILSTADENGTCFGMQIVGLEASPEGREVLQRLCNVVEQYYQLNQSGVKQRDYQSAK
jgi:hypothetical protein